MKKFKDFIYDYNDVLVALLIVVCAGVIIFWRVNTVLDYSNYYQAQQEVKQLDIDFTNVDLTQEKTEIIDDVPDETKTDEPAPPVCQHTYENGVCTQCGEKDPNYVEPQVPTVKTYTIEVSSKLGTGNWTSCGKLLEKEGIVKNANDFVAKAIAKKLETSLQPGTYELNSDMSYDEMVEILAKKR